MRKNAQCSSAISISSDQAPIFRKNAQAIIKVGQFPTSQLPWKSKLLHEVLRGLVVWNSKAAVPNQTAALGFTGYSLNIETLPITIFMITGNRL